MGVGGSLVGYTRAPGEGGESGRLCRNLPASPSARLGDAAIAACLAVSWDYTSSAHLAPHSCQPYVGQQYVRQQRAVAVRAAQEGRLPLGHVARGIREHTVVNVCRHTYKGADIGSRGKGCCLLQARSICAPVYLTSSSLSCSSPQAMRATLRAMLTASTVFSCISGDCLRGIKTFGCLIWLERSDFEKNRKEAASTAHCIVDVVKKLFALSSWESPDVSSGFFFCETCPILNLKAIKLPTPTFVTLLLPLPAAAQQQARHALHAQHITYTHIALND